MLAQDLLVVVRTILTATISMVDAILRWCPICNCHFQCVDGKITLHPVVHGVSTAVDRKSKGVDCKFGGRNYKCEM